MPNGPTVPTDISNDTVMRAWYQALWRSLQNLGVEGTANQIAVANGDFGSFNLAQISFADNLIFNGFTLSADGDFNGHELKNATITVGNAIRTITNKFKERLSVKDYGAVGNGTTDDTSAFSAAITAATSANKALYIPTGTYKLTSTITISNPISIIGDGPGVSILEPYLGTAGGDLFLIQSSDVTFRDFAFDGVNVGSVTLTNNEYMIHVNPTSGTLNRIEFKNLRFSNLDFKAGVKDLDTLADIRAAYAIKIEDADRVNVENCSVISISGGFVYTTGVSCIEITKNYIRNALLHPICIHDTTNYFNIVGNYFDPSDSVGVFLGGVIDVASDSGTQCHHGNIEANFVKGIYGTAGYVSYGAVIRVLSSTDVNISNNFMSDVTEGTLNSDTDFAENYNIKIGTAGTSSSDDNGPCKRINIMSNFIGGCQDANESHMSGILIENNYQLDSLHQAEDIKIIGNQLFSSAAGVSGLNRGITVSGKSSGIKNVVVEDNTVIVALEGTSSAYGVGRGAISFVSTDATGQCSQIYIGGNRVQDLANTGINALSALICIGQYTSEVFNTKPNYLKGYSYGVVTETGSGPNLWYLDDNYYEQTGANTTKFVFNVQPKSRHTNISGNTASRPTSTDYLTDYMTYFDTTLGTPIWYNGSSWITSWGGAATSTFAEDVSDQVGSMVTGNTETGITVTYQDSDNTIDFVVSDTTVAGDTGSVAITPGGTLTVAGGTNISTAVVGSTLTVSSTAATPAPVGAQYVTLATDATLTNERVLTAGTGIGLTDAGAGSTITVAGLDATSTIKGIAKYDSSDFTVTAGNAVINDSGIDHNATTNYDANKHIDHTAVTLTAGEGITGGGTIAASRSFALDFSDLSTTTTSIAGTDLISSHDGAQKKITWANAKASIDAVGTLTTGTWSATTIAVNKGGTGQTSYTDGQLLIGNTSGNTLTKATITGGTGINITNGNGTIQIDSTLSTVDWVGTCLVASTANLNATYLNGVAGVGASLTNATTQAALTIDGVALAVNDRVLIKDQTSSFQNGIYVVTTVGTIATNWVITRSSDYNQTSEIMPGTLVPVDSGTVNIDTLWIQSNTVTTIGTDPVSFTQFVYNIQPLSKGGTSANLTASNGGIFYSTGSAGAILSGTSTAKQILMSGASTTPIWSTATYPNTAIGTGTLLRADGTNWVATTSTYPTTNAVSTLLYASSANVMSALATGNSGTLITDSGGVPSISSTLPSTVQGNITSVGTITSGTWSGTAIALNKGGTNAALTASNGGIFYSTASAGAILSGTATAGQLLTSGASTTPAWTTSTYPLTNAVSTLLYASSANVMAALATANNGVLITGSGGIPSISSTIPNATQDNITRTGTITSGTWTGTTIAVANGGTGQTSYTNGQLLIGNTTGNTLAKATLTAGAAIAITNGASSITVAAASMPACLVTRITSDQTVSNNTVTKVQFNSATFDITSNYDAATNYRFTPNQAGLYFVTVSIVTQTVSGTKQFSAYVYKNGSQVAGSAQYIPDQGASDALLQPTSIVLSMNGTTDYIEAYYYQNTGGNANIRATAVCYMAITYAGKNS